MVWHLDIQHAYLNGDLEEDPLVEQPPILNNGTKNVWKLHKTLYGIKLAAHEWHKTVVKVLHDLVSHAVMQTPVCMLDSTADVYFPMA